MLGRPGRNHNQQQNDSHFNLQIIGWNGLVLFLQVFNLLSRHLCPRMHKATRMEWEKAIRKGDKNDGLTFFCVSVCVRACVRGREGSIIDFIWEYEYKKRKKKESSEKKQNRETETICNLIRCFVYIDLRYCFYYADIYLKESVQWIQEAKKQTKNKNRDTNV